MRFLSFSAVLLLLAGAPLFGQEQTASVPAHISFVEGDATLSRDGSSEPAVLNMPVLDGDRITTTSGRIEVTFADGSAVEIDPDSDVEFLGGTRVRVVAGAIEHRAAPAVPSNSSPYLPDDLRPYGSDFDRYGTWQYQAGYGNVWYPSVAADWRPYYYGYWEPLPVFGWTWIGYDRWTWPTHHYGRWGYARNRWFWIPGRTWAAAWVSWGTGPDYIGWCPLGYDGRAVSAFSVGYRASWNAWTIMPRDHFGRRGFPAQRYALEPYRIASTTPFVIHRNAPLIDHRRPSADGFGARAAVPRGDRSTGIYSDDRGAYSGDRAVYSGDRGTNRTPRRDGRAAENPQRGRAYERRPEAAPPPRAAERVQPPALLIPNGGGRVPRPTDRGSESRVPRPTYRAPGASSAIPPPAMREQRPTPQWPTTQERRPMTNDGRVPSRDQPAYQPRYEPRYQPQAVPREVPRMRESAPPPRQAAPPPQRQSAPRAAPAGPRGGQTGRHQRDGGRRR